MMGPSLQPPDVPAQGFISFQKTQQAQPGDLLESPKQADPMPQTQAWQKVD